MKTYIFFILTTFSLVILLQINACKDPFNDDFYKKSKTSTSFEINKSGILNFQILRYVLKDNTGKIESIIDSLRVRNISGNDIKKIDFVLRFFDSEKFDTESLLLSFSPDETNKNSILKTNNEIIFFLDDHTRILMDEKKVAIYIFKTGSNLDFESSGLYNNTYKFIKYDTVSKLPDEYDTIVVETGTAITIIDYQGYIKAKPDKSKRFDLLAGFIDPNGLFLGEVKSDSLVTGTSIANSLSFPDDDETTLNIFSVQNSSTSDTVYQIQFTNFLK